MADLRAFTGPNAGYVLDLYDQYQANPGSVDPEWRAFFADFDATLPDSAPRARGSAATSTVDPARIAGAVTLATAIRDLGHLAASLDPLGTPPPGAPELEPSSHGVTDADLAQVPASVVGGPASVDARSAAEALRRLREIYSGTTGFDFDHVHDPAQRQWLSAAIEERTFAKPLEKSAKRALLRRLTDVEGFERFLHQTYLGQKRFSIEGNDILVPMLDEIVHTAAGKGAREIIVGMAHRGRLNVMTHVLGKPYAAIISAFEGHKSLPQNASDASDDWSGDVKYHLGARLLRGEEGVVEVPLVLAPNPSHLEAVNPVVEGMARSSQDITDHAGAPGWDAKASMAILIHGDAAFPGQGSVAETLNLSGLAGYTTGGTIHIIVNNQIGFTTNPDDSRSTLYASDLAKGFEIPVVHVNADDAEACLAAVRMATAYRDAFGKDFLIDLVGYRRWGHNEGDEPGFTQPKLYEVITRHPTARAILADQLVADGSVSPDEPEAMLKETMDALAAVRRSVTDGTADLHEDIPVASPRREVKTALTKKELLTYQKGIHATPEGFSLNPKLARQWDRRATVLDSPDGRIDWAHAEALAFAAIVSDGTPIRLTGQDAQRGTFSQRHLTLHDPKTDEEWTPIQHLETAKASFVVYNSPLSELAALGFEYGYSVHHPERLVLWEGQFGDFANGAQVIIDQFISAARSKWRALPALVMLLPHGYEGQGPEHSSGRLERYLQLAAQDNIRVANCTTAAQYFHLLRRQALLLEVDPRPLVIMTPKSLLRNPLASSAPEEFLSGTFQPVLDDPTTTGREQKVTRLVLCSGKVAVDLFASADRAGADDVAIARVEQIAPFQNSAIRAVIDRYPNLQEIAWVQEEPRNMGAWTFMDGRLRDLVGDRVPIRYIGRPDRASPAEGSADLHLREQGRIVSEALSAGAKPAAAKQGTAKNGAAKNGHATVSEAKPAAKKPARSRS